LRKSQQEQAIQLKRDLNQQMINERKQVKDSIGAIDNISIQNVDRALAKTSIDGSMPSPKKGKYARHLLAASDNAVSDSW